MHRSRLPLWLLTSLTLLLGAPCGAAAQERGPRLHVGAGMVLDFAGDVELDRGAIYNPGHDGLRATPGIRGHVDYQLLRHLTLGGMARMSWWEPSYTPRIGRSFLFDLGPRLLGKFDYRQFRFYGAISPGLTVSAVRDYGIGVNGAAAGFTLSITAAGLEWWFSRRAALFAELGWVGHWFSHDSDQGPGNLNFRLSQGLLELGFVFGM
ncbi:MAG: hypothetical protein JWN04_637 [Myxococcaceae bacterium]|nr:hypothetical protein [Myxococcaceae bacterium]